MYSILLKVSSFSLWICQHALMNNNDEINDDNNHYQWIIMNNNE